MNTPLAQKAVNLLRFATRAGRHFFNESRCFACGVPVSKKEPLAESSHLICSKCLKDIDILYKGYCKACGLPFPSGSSALGPCSQCLKTIPPWRACYVLAPYAGLLQKIILSLKFGGSLHMSHVLGELLAARIKSLAALSATGATGALSATGATGATGVENECAPAFSVIVPVPLHPLRLKERGWNQSLEIARVMGKRLNIPVDKNLLLRVRNDPPQESLGREARWKAIKGTFSAISEAEGKSILLVDDVMTTCATMHECSKVLLGKGAACISVAVAGRTPNQF